MDFNKKKVMEALWTARWNLNHDPKNIEDIKKCVTEALVELGDKWTEASEPKKPLEAGGDEPERPSVSEPGKKAMWIPFAQRLPAMKAQGKYEKNYPVGMVVHFTAGRCDSEEDCKGSMDWGRGEGYLFLGLGPTGVLYQTNPLSDWGHHCGSSSWPNLGSSLSNKLIGCEISAAGRVDENGRSWFGKVFSKDRLRTVGKDHAVSPGTYVKYTEAQEHQLIELCLWLKANNPEVFNFDYVLGHDEIAPTRKNDPGGALSMSMPKFRELLKEEYQKRLKIK